MAVQRKRRLKRWVRVFLSALILVGLFALLYGIFFPELMTPPTPASASQSSQSASSQTPVWPEGTDYGFPIPPSGENRTILIDAGHGGRDGGNIAADGTLEKNLTLSLALKLKAHLEKQMPQLNVALVRDSDAIDDWSTSSWADLSYRMQAQEKAGADYVLSLHVDALDDPAQSGSLFYLNGDDTLTRDLAARMGANLQKVGLGAARGVLTMEDYPLQNISMSNAHALQLEVGALSNPQDLEILKNEQKQEEIAAGMASALTTLIADHPQAPAYQSRQKDIEQKTASEERRLSEEKRKSEEASRKAEEERKKSEEQSRQAAAKKIGKAA